MSFLDYTGKVDPEGIYYVFDMGEKVDPLEEAYHLNIANPTIDNCFKKIFYTKSEITKSFLNAILFPNDKRITDLKFLPTERPGEAESYAEGSIRMDCVCKCILKPLKKYPKENLGDDLGLYSNDTELVVDIEMQIGLKPNQDDISMGYLRALCQQYEKNKILVLVLLYTPNIKNPRKNKGNIIAYGKEEFKNPVKIQKREDCIIYQLDLNYCAKLMEKGEDLWILNESQIFADAGKEWIKLFSIPIWCKQSKEKYYYFPPLDQLSFKDLNVKSALSLLANSDFSYEKNYIDQKNMENLIEDYHKIKEDNDILKQDNNMLKEDNDMLKEDNEILNEEMEKWRKKYYDLLNHQNGGPQENKKQKYPKK